VFTKQRKDRKAGDELRYSGRIYTINQYCIYPAIKFAKKKLFNLIIIKKR
jgi:site-specific DNA-adenine methylase